MTNDQETTGKRRVLAAGLIALTSWILLICALAAALQQPLLV